MIDEHKNVVLRTLNKTGAILIRPSGEVDPKSLYIDAIFPHALAMNWICRHFTDPFCYDNAKHKDVTVDAVAGLSAEGFVLSSFAASRLDRAYNEYRRKPGQRVAAVYAQKGLNPGFIPEHIKFINGKNVLAVIDVIAKDRRVDNSTEQLVTAIRSVGGIVVGLCAIVNLRKNVQQDFPDIPLIILADLSGDEKKFPYDPEKK